MQSREIVLVCQLTNWVRKLILGGRMQFVDTNIRAMSSLFLRAFFFIDIMYFSFKNYKKKKKILGDLCFENSNILAVD